MSGSTANITFDNYPSSNRVPGTFAEVNNSRANTASFNQRALIIGQMTSSGNATANSPQIYAGSGPAATAFGANSMLALLAGAYRRTDTFGEVWCLPLADDASATAASQTITPSGTATAAGVVSLYIAGTRVSTSVAVGDTATNVATNMLTAIQATPNLPVTATNASGVITLTAVNKGEAGNEIEVRLNYRGAAGGEATPAGISFAFSGMADGAGYLCTGGATNPTLTTALANLPAQPFDFIICPYTDSASLAALKTFLDDQTGRWSWEQELFGGYFAAYRGTLASLTTFGTGNNDQHGSIVSMYDMPEPAWIVAAKIAGACAVSIRANPAVPLQDIPVPVMAPPEQSQFDISERNTLLYDGLSTLKFDQSGQAYIERMVTTYQTNAAGQPDNSYLDVETMYELTAYIRDTRTFISSRFSRKILVADGSSIPYGSDMTTAQIVLSSVIARYRTLAASGLVQEPATFAKNAAAQNAGNGLVKLLLPVLLANQLRQVAMLVQFSKP